MQFPSRSRALVALVCLLTAAFAALPLAAAAQASSDTILFGRVVNGPGDDRQVSSAIFTIGDNGLNERQLTPYTTNEFDAPGIGNYLNSWLTNAFNPAGTYSVLLPAQSSYSLNVDNAADAQGKYVLMNAYGVRTTPLFYGANDLQSPKVGPSYGSVSWGPAGNDQIAYVDNADAQFGKHPACVKLMNSNGTNNHVLWCADTWNYCALEAIRWSGDGTQLMVAAVHSDHNTSPVTEADVYLIDTATGAGTLVQANVQEPYTGGGVGDVSYDAHEVIFGMIQTSNGSGPCNAAIDGNYLSRWCAKNMLTGQTVALADPNNVVAFSANGQALISPDGSQAFIVGAVPFFAPYDDEIYDMQTDGSGFKQVSSPCTTVTQTTTVYWAPVRVSQDGTRLLANCIIQTQPDPGNVVLTSQIWIINLVDGSSSFVTNGTAYDWHTQ